MTAAERTANEGLRAGADAYRFGQITREDYRARRRQILGALDGRIDPEPVEIMRVIVTPPMPEPPETSPEPPEISPERKRRIWSFGIGAALLAVLTIWFALHGF